MATREQAYGELEVIYGGTEAFDRQMQKKGTWLTGLPQDDLAKKRYSNMAYLSFATGKQPKELAPVFDQLRSAYAKEIFGKDEADDDMFYGLVQQKFSKERATRVLASDFGTAIMQRAAKGDGDFYTAYAETWKEFKGKAGWDEKIDQEGGYWDFSRKQWDNTQDKMLDFAPALEAAETFFATSGGYGGDTDELVEGLSGLSKEDAFLILDIAASRQKETKEVTDQAKTPFFGTEKIKTPLGSITVTGPFGINPATAAKPFLRAGRGAGRLMTSAGEEITEIGKATPWWDGTDEDQHKAAIQRRIQGYITGELDPLKGDTWLGEAMLKTADMLPYALSASNFTSLPVAYLALQNDARNELIDNGVDPETANNIAMAAGPILTGIEMVQSRLAFFGIKGMKPLKDAAVKSIVTRFATRTTAALAGETLTEFSQEMTTPLMQELWSKFDEAVPSAEIGKDARVFWENSPELMVSMLPLVLIGAGSTTKYDTQRAIAMVRLETPLRALGFAEADVQNAIEATLNGRVALSDALRQGYANRRMDTPEAAAAREELQGGINAGAVNEEYDVSTGQGDKLIVTRKEDGAVIANASNEVEAQQAMLDDEFKRLMEAEEAKAAETEAAEESADPADVRSLGDTEHETMPDRPPSTPREDIEAYKKLTAEIAALPPEKQADATMEAFNLKLSLQNRHFNGHNPSEELLPKKEAAQKPKQVTAEQAVMEPTPFPQRDGGNPIRLTTALNKREITLKRELDGRQKLSPPERRSQAMILNQVKRDGSWTGTLNRAKELLTGEDMPSDKEHMAALVAIADAENRYESLQADADALSAQGREEEAKGKRAVAEGVLTEIDIIEQGFDKGGSRLGQALAARRREIDKKRYELVPLLRKAREKKGSDLSEQEREELTRLSQQVIELQSEITRLEQELSSAQAKVDKEMSEEFINERIGKRSAKKREGAKLRREELKQQLKALGYRLNAINDGAGFTAEAMNIVAEIAQTYIEEGTTKLHEITGKLKMEIPDLSDQDIFNALARRSPNARKKIATETGRRIKELKKQAKLWAEIHDAMNGVFAAGKAVDPGSAQIQALREIFTKLRLQANQSIMDEKQLAHWEEKLRSVTEQLEGGFRTVDIELEKKEQNERVEAVKEAVKEVRREMAALDTLFELEDQKRTGGRTEAGAKEAEKNPRIAKIRQQIAEIRSEFAKEKSTEKTRARLKRRLEDLNFQLDTESRLLTENKEGKADPVDVAQMREDAKLLQREMDLRDTLFDLEEQLRTGKFAESEKAAGVTNQTIQLLEDRTKELRAEVAKRKNAPKQAQNAIERLQKQLADIQAQRAGGFRFIPETKERRPVTVEEKELRDAVREVENLLRTEDAIFDLQEQLRFLEAGEFDKVKVNASEKRLLKSEALQDAQIKKRQLQRQIENKLENIRKKTFFERGVDVLLSPRAFQSTGDLSAIGRQGLLLVAKDIFSRNMGRNALKASAEYFHVVFSERQYDAIASEMEATETYRELTRLGMEFQELDGKTNKRDEHFMTNLAEKVPGFGLVVRGGNRGMITFLNLMRYSAGQQILENYKDSSIDTRRRMMDLVNKMSGRGNLGSAKAITKELNTLFYAPKYAISRWQLGWYPLIRLDGKGEMNIANKDVMKEYIHSLSSFILFSGTVAMLASWAGLDIGDDPTKHDFMKVRAGNVTYDFMGGMQQPIRMATLLSIAPFKRDERWFDTMDWGMTVARYKFNPAVTVPHELLTGKDWRGQPVEVWETLLSSVSPIILQETVEAMNNAPDQTVPVVAAGVLGIGTIVQEPKKSKKKPQPK